MVAPDTPAFSTALCTSLTVAPWAGTSHEVPPLKSMPQLKPLAPNDTRPKHDDEARRREPPPAPAHEVELGLAPVDADEGVGTALLGLLLGGLGGRRHALALASQCQTPGHPDDAGLGDAGATAEEDDQWSGEEEGREHVQQGGEAEEEGEASHRAHGQDVEDDGRGQRHQVGGQDGAERAPEAPVHTGAHRSRPSGPRP